MGTLRVEAGNPAPSASGPGGQTSAFAYISWTMIRYTTMVRQSGATPISGVEEGADAILKLALSPEPEGKSGLYFNGQREARADAQPTMPSRANGSRRTLSSWPACRRGSARRLDVGPVRAAGRLPRRF